MFNRLYVAQTDTHITVPFSLTKEQWEDLAEALSNNSYALLRDIKDGVAEDSPGPDASGVLKVGPLELGLLYQWLFNPVDEAQAHNYLHALKKAAKESGVEAVKAVLGVLFNDRRFTGVCWMNYPNPFPIVSLSFEEGLLAQIASFVRDPTLSYLEPYEGGAVCFVDQPHEKDNMCY
ncbi:hypothetical protein D7X12_12400 [Corallococcus sicarius]|uniref:Uncharacterized protein n=2 Tax=Corallococcus sicarius TaxID=2316726 RepID=A0A3A8NHC8_9BACT|nr:hypothetical protein D7X12_12400 [Corallococcus sicarius]